MSELVLVIGNKNYSSWSLRPWLLMRHHGLSFREKRVPLYTETTNDELAAYDSDFKVPILADGELVVWDSLSILEYVSETHLDRRGWPVDPNVRAVARSVSAEMHSSFSNVRNELPMNCRKRFDHVELSDGAKREIERIKSLWRRCRGEHADKGEWLFGEFSIADAMFAPLALRFHGYNIPLGDVQREYVLSVLNHPAVAEWMEAGRNESEVIDAAEINAWQKRGAEP